MFQVCRVYKRPSYILDDEGFVAYGGICRPVDDESSAPGCERLPSSCIRCTLTYVADMPACQYNRTAITVSAFESSSLYLRFTQASPVPCCAVSLL